MSVTDALEQLSNDVFQRELNAIEKTLTKALQEVLEQPVQFKATASFKRDAASVEFSIERAGHAEDIMRGQGGSVANIVSVGLRMFAITMLDERRHRKFLVLDEQDCWLHPDLVPKLVKIVREAGQALGFQVLMISHHDVANFIRYADRVYRLSPDRGEGVGIEQIQTRRTIDGRRLAVVETAHVYARSGTRREFHFRMQIVLNYSTKTFSNQTLSPPMIRILLLATLLFGSAVRTTADDDAKGSEWIQLFNGKDLDGWTPKIRYHELGDNHADTFRVEDGCLESRLRRLRRIQRNVWPPFYKDKFSHYRYPLRIQIRRRSMQRRPRLGIAKQRHHGPWRRSPNNGQGSRFSSINRSPIARRRRQNKSDRPRIFALPERTWSKMASCSNRIARIRRRKPTTESNG